MNRSFALALVLLLPASPALAEVPTGKLLSFTNSVLLRRTGSSEWGRVKAGEDLYRDDTIYTMADSYAGVRFETGESLNLTPNTLVVLRPPSGGAPGAEMLSGELRSWRSRVVTRTATILPKSEDAEFTTRMKKDFTTVVRVTRGVAEVQAQGKKVEVRQGYATEVRPNMAPAAPVAAPEPAELREAPSAADVPGAELPEHALAAIKVMRAYRLQAAGDPAFSKVLLDRTFEPEVKPDLSALLPAGTYFIRLAAIDLLGYQGKFSAPRRVRVGPK
ncbi:MAG: hypothetical protein M0011_01255 [Elusimicrobia bacterium]|nr:hypothetical protein [Elusimicrobiota bacterium]